MANRFVAYPLKITKTANGYLVEGLSQDAGAAGEYVFANMADLTYWMALNEQPPA